MVRLLKVSAWDDAKGPISEAGARAMFRPLDGHRFFKRDMPQSAAIAGNAQERTLVMLEGRAHMTWAGKRHLLQPGDIAQIPQGEFLFESSGPVSFLAVYRLPPELWPN